MNDPGLSGQTVDLTEPTGDKLAVTLECPPCAATRTYVLDETLRHIATIGDWQGIRVAATCHCTYRTVVTLGWHDNGPEYTMRPVVLSPEAFTAFDTAGICATRDCAVSLNWWPCPVCGKQGHGIEAHPNIAKESP